MLFIDDILPDSPAWRAGLRRGDSIVSANGATIHDALDLQFYIEDEEEVELLIRRSGKELAILLENPLLEPTGIEPHPIGLRRCSNNCIFCFIDQQPPGLRESLYVKDEDIRHSFLHGNYITLSNTPEWEIERVITQRMSPLYISVHATDEKIRRKLLGNNKIAPILPLLKRMTESGVWIHTQVVVVPEVNDSDEVLDRTISDLYSLGENSLSCALVPVGLTRYRVGLPRVRPVLPETARRIIELSDAMRSRFDRPNFLQLADEFFLLADKELPPDTYYGDYPQLENGVGMTRLFIEDMKEIDVTHSIAERYGTIHVDIVTGTRAAKIFEKIPENLGIAGVKSRIIGIENRFWGSSVNVANLLTGNDIIDVISGRESDIIFLPPKVLNDEGLFLDGKTLADVDGSVRGAVVVGPRYLSEVQEYLLSKYI